MDFERATIKALFYDYPIEAAVQTIAKLENNSGKDDYLDILPLLVRWRESDFTTTEAHLINTAANDLWMGRTHKSSPTISRSLYIILDFAKKMLVRNPKNQYPQVIFSELLRWKDITLYVGEDIFTTAYIANLDKEYKLTEIFDWQDKIEHNDIAVNHFLSQGLTDLHAHFNASADVFALNWISLMNGLAGESTWEQKLCTSQDVILSTDRVSQLYPLRRICVAAAFLRLQLYKALFINSSSWDKLHEVKYILEDEFYSNKKRRDLQSEISVLRTFSLKAANDKVIDYAITPTQAIFEHRTNAHLVFHGERRIMYEFFYRYFQDNPTTLVAAPYFYLYILLKTHVRKEFVQINQLKGFENFQTYQSRKHIFLRKEDPLFELYNRIVFQTSVRNNSNDYLEGRVTPKSLPHYTNASDYTQGVFTKESVQPKANEHLAFVAHFIKANYCRSNQEQERKQSNRQDFARYNDYRSKLKEEINMILTLFKQQQNYASWDYRKNDIHIVGIDAASTEMFCRPEVFGHVYRFAKLCGLYNRTYHVGEDFFDVIDGLRAIDEALLFLDLDSYCRIGHALAMGINVEDYYNRRRFRILGPKQYVLDNCVWLIKKTAHYDIELSSPMKENLCNIAQEMYQLIGYEEDFNINHYWNSMLLRGDEPNMIDANNSITSSPYIPYNAWHETAQVHTHNVDIARLDKIAQSLYNQYQFCQKVKENGEETCDDRYKYFPDITNVAKKLQEAIRREVAQKQIGVETCPTSNLKIGYIDTYKNHPLLTCYDPISKQSDVHYPLQKVSVNTDDRGVFDTTLYMEYSLLALSLQKQQKPVGCQIYGSRQIAEYIEHLREANEQQRFK